MLQETEFESPFEESVAEAGPEGEEQGFDESFRDESFRDEVTEYGAGAPVMEEEVFPSGLSLARASGATGPGEEHWDPTGTNLPLLDTGAPVRPKKLSANFTVGELVTSGGKPADIARISPTLVRLLQLIRDRVAKPVKVTSGYRSWKRNGIIYKGYGKPVTKSQHCAGRAADITVAGMTGMDIAKVAIDVWGPDVAVGVGPYYAHVDVRGRGDTWTYFGKGTLKNAAALTEIARYRRAHKGGGVQPVPVPPAPLPIVPGTTKAGGLVVRSVALLGKHRGSPPDLVLGWNSMANPAAIDVVVHLHGFSASAAAMRIETEKRPISGLDVGGRSRPTLTVLPRGDFYGGSSGRGYHFPALITAGALEKLTTEALAAFTRATGVSAPRGRLVLTAHSGGGKALLAILGHNDPDEVHVFDALYQPSTALAQWAARRIPADPAASMRVFYRAGTKKHPGTQPASEALAATLCTLLSGVQPGVRARFRVERTTVDHGSIARRYGGTLLADAGSDVADALRFTCPPGTAKEVHTAGTLGMPSEAAGSGWLEYQGTEPGESTAAEEEDGEVEAAEGEESEAEDPQPEAYEPAGFEFEPPGYEGLDQEDLGLEAFEPEEFDAEYFVGVDGPGASSEDPWSEGISEGLAWEPEVESGAETEDFGAAADAPALEAPPAASVVFPSGFALPYLPATAASDPVHADPHGTGLPLLAISPSSLGRALSKNFTVRELVANGGVPASVARISPELVRVLQAIRDRAGRAVVVDAGYRPNGFGGAAADKESRHTSGQGADIRIAGVSGDELARLAIDAAGPELAIGIAVDGIHVDVRGRWTLWTIIPGQRGADAMNRVALHRAKFTPPGPTPPVPPTADARFSAVRRGVLSSADPAERLRLLEAGIAFARVRARTERATAGNKTSVTAKTRAIMMCETGIGLPTSPQPHLDENVLFGRVNDDRVEDAYRSWFENPTQSASPWILLGVWAKEGLTTQPVGPRVQATSIADARSIWRSRFFFVNMGTDHFVKTIAVAGQDNKLVENPGSGVQHDRVFRPAVAAQLAAGRLPRDISPEIDGQLNVTPVPGSAGEFIVSPTRRFAVLSLMLVDAFWRENQAAAVREVVPTPRPLDLLGLTYMRWNMRASSWRQLLGRDMTQNRDSDGTVPSLPLWAFHRTLIAGQFNVPRANALRTRLNFVVFRSVYEGD